MAQRFKNGNAVEEKFYQSGLEICENIGLAKDEFFDEAYATFLLGEVLYDSGRAPLANAIARNIFRSSFPEIFDAFISAGTAESYITVFKKIFGDDADITFTVPNDGHLQILIEAQGIELSNFISREIEDNQFVYNNITDQDGNTIVFQSIKGFTSEYELKQMLFEMVPAGIYTEITLTLG